MIDHVWLDWSLPCLPQAGRWLLDHAESPGELSDWMVVTPGARAGRLLVRVLLDESRDRGTGLVPPRIVTPSVLAEAALPLDRPVATHAERVLAWMHVLRSERSLTGRLVRRPPDAADLAGWYEVASMLAELHRELGGELVTFDLVAHICGELALDLEVDRWRTLAALRTRTVEYLAFCGLADADEAASQWLAESGPRSSDLAGLPRRLVLVGIVELTRVQQAIVRAIGESAAALIHAPRSMAGRFDEIGCVLPEAWADVNIDIPSDTVIMCDRPRDQAQAAIRMLSTLARRAGGLRTDQVVIGLGDESLGDSIVRAADEVTTAMVEPSSVGGEVAGAGHAKLVVHLAPGIPLERTGPWRLLDGLHRWLDEPRFAHLAALVRHPQVEHWLADGMSAEREPPSANLGEEESDGSSAEPTDPPPSQRLHRRSVPALLDQYFSDHLHERLDGELLGDETIQRQLHQVRERIAILAAPLDGPNRPLGSWDGAILTVLNRAYEGVELDAVTRAAGEQIRDACRQLRQIPAALQAEVSGAQALRLILSMTARQAGPSPVRAGQIDAVGWLELHLDPAEHVLVTGFNDGRVPGAITADPFLPDGLRARLGLNDNRRRYARDAYLLEAMRQSRVTFTVILGRHDGAGEPLLPSRLLLAVPPADLPPRVLHLTDASVARSWRAPLGAPNPGDETRFAVPKPPPGPIQVPRLRVTQFKAYLACPYRFWLGHLLGLQEADDRADELDPLRFGSMLHGVLRLVGEDPTLRDATGADVIADRLRAALREHAQARFGDDPMPAVRIQLARMAQRIEAFARAQAAHRRNGWLIEHTELALPESAVLDLQDDAPMRVTATIDRVDRRGKEWLLVDYKSSESGAKPEDAHGPRRNGRWIDLQLPLYEHLFREFVEPTATPEATRLAYFVLPKKADDAGLLLAQWTPEQRKDAVDEARRIARAVRAGDFVMSRIPPSNDPFAAICHTMAFATGADDGDIAGGDDSNGGEP